MGRVEIFIRAVVAIGQPDSIELLISNIFAFMFLPINASRENYSFTGQDEIDYCMNRREEILKALKDVAKFITDSKLMSEVVLCLELCEQLPGLNHKALILDICKNITVINLENLSKLSSL